TSRAGSPCTLSEVDREPRLEPLVRAADTLGGRGVVAVCVRQREREVLEDLRADLRRDVEVVVRKVVEYGSERRRVLQLDGLTEAAVPLQLDAPRTIRSRVLACIRREVLATVLRRDPQRRLAGRLAIESILHAGTRPRAQVELAERVALRGREHERRHARGRTHVEIELALEIARHHLAA